MNYCDRTRGCCRLDYRGGPRAACVDGATSARILCDSDQLRESVFAHQANREQERGGIADEHLRARRRSAHVVAALVW